MIPSAQPALRAAAIAILCAALPTTEASAGMGFVPPAGSVWVKLAYSRWTANQRFAGPFNPEDLNYDGGREPGDLVPVKIDTPGSTFANDSMTLDVQVTPIDRLTFGFYFPFFQKTVFDQDTVQVETRGTGDFFGYAGYQLTPPGIPVGTSLYLRFKIPTTAAQFTDLSVPLSEGQVDIGFESVTTWAVLPRLHLTGRIGYRVRFEVEQRVGDATARFKPGNETEIGLEIGGGPWHWLWLRAGWWGMFGAAWEDRSVPNAILAVEQRTVHNLEVAAYVSFGQFIHRGLAGLALDAWFRYPVAGTDYLSGPSFSVGLAWGFNWHE